MTTQDWINRRDHGAGIVELQLGKGPSNALTADFLGDFTAAINQLSDDNEVRVVLLSSPFNAFCSGTDSSDDPEKLQSAFNLALITLYACPKPTIAVINGDVFDAGLSLVQMCDSRIGMAKTGYGYHQIHHGNAPTQFETAFLAHTMDPNVARRLMLTGQTIGPVSARNYGLVDIVTEDQEDLWMFSLREAKAYAGFSAENFAQSKLSLRGAIIDEMKGQLG